MTFTQPLGVLEQVSGATIIDSDVSDEEGMHLYLSDGRVLIIVGQFAISLMRVSNEKLH